MSGAAADGGAAGGRGVWRDALTAAVAVVGLIDSVYLTVEHLSGRSVRCVVVSGCDAVLSSDYATIAGTIPLAAAGGASYFVVFSLATLAAFGYGVRAPLKVLVGLMFAFTLWLLYVQAFVLRAFCAYCLLSAAVTATLTLLVIVLPPLARRRRLA